MPPIRPRPSPDQGSRIGGTPSKARNNPYRNWVNPRSRTADTHNEIRNPLENYSPWANRVGGTPQRGHPAPKPGQHDYAIGGQGATDYNKGLAKGRNDRNNVYMGSPDRNKVRGYTTTTGSINKYDSGNRNQQASNRRNPRATALNNVRKRYV